MNKYLNFKNLMSISLLFFLSLNSFGQHDHGGESDGEWEGPTSGGHMYNLPIHAMLGLDGSIMMHYGIGTNMHGGHSGHMGTGMGHSGGMGNSGHMGNSGDMGHSGNMGHGSDHNMGDINHNNNHSSHSNSKVSLMIMPMVHLGGDTHKRIINLSKAKYKKINHGRNQKDSSEIALVELQSSEKGYLVVENKRAELGIGPMLMVAPNSISWGLWANAGVMPYVGAWTYSERKVLSKDEAQALPRMKVPRDSEDLESWKKGDKFKYSVHGGVMFTGGVGVTIFLDAGAMFMVQGKFKVTVEKVGDTKVKVQYKKERLTHLAAMVNTVISNINTGRFGSSDKAFSFIFDLSDEDALNAYKNMIRGDITEAQELVQNSDHQAVKQVMKSYSKTKGRISSFSVGIPVLARASLSKGKLELHSNTYNFLNGMEIINHMGVYLNERKNSGVWSDHKHKMWNFMGMHSLIKMKIEDKENPGKFKTKLMKSHMGSFQWLYESDRMRTRKLKKYLNRLKEKTGLYDHLKVSFPEKRNLGYIRAEFSLDIGPKGLTKLISLSQKRGDWREAFSKNLNAHSKAWFSQKDLGDTLLEICPKMRLKKNCQKHLRKETLKSSQKMRQLLSEMGNYLKEENYKKFSKAYGKFGKYFLKNPFTFKTTLSLLGEKNARMAFRVRGENFQDHKIKISLKGENKND